MDAEPIAISRRNIVPGQVLPVEAAHIFRRVESCDVGRAVESKAGEQGLRMNKRNTCCLVFLKNHGALIYYHRLKVGKEVASFP